MTIYEYMGWDWQCHTLDGNDMVEAIQKMREKLGEEKYLLFLETLVDKSKFWGWMTNTLLAKVIDLFILNPAALIDRASEYLEKED